MVEKLGGDGERAKAGKLQPALFNLYRQARQAERLKENTLCLKIPCLLSLFSSVPSQCSVMGVQLLRMWFSSTRMVCLWKLRLVQSVYQSTAIYSNVTVYIISHGSALFYAIFGTSCLLEIHIEDNDEVRMMSQLQIKKKVHP